MQCKCDMCKYFVDHKDSSEFGECTKSLFSKLYVKKSHRCPKFEEKEK